MISLILVAALAAGFYVGWNIGSNDAANAMGTAVGGRVLTYRRAIVIMILFVILGAVLEGSKVMETVGEGIVLPPASVEYENPLTKVPVFAVIALVSAGLWVTIATTLRLPVSTSQSIVGAVMGAGILISFFEPEGIGANVQFGKLGSIGLCWILTPIGAAIFAFIIYKLLSPLLRRVKDVATLNRIFGLLIIIAGAFTAYALGANDVGNATGMIYAVGGGGTSWSPQIIALFGGVALAIGSLTYSWRVMQTVGGGITRLDAVTACAAQLGAALTVWTFTQFGIPVSTSQAIVGGVVGAGLVKGVAAVSKRRLGEIGVAWILTPTAAASLTFLLGWLAIGVM
ncbi:MAG: inorganic phosphate transporter [Candidatus Hadarchaeota archaeon]|nr:inorganic phosphate transporter [Candidatus Hadarchaeota archaeon]